MMKKILSNLIVLLVVSTASWAQVAKPVPARSTAAMVDSLAGPQTFSRSTGKVSAAQIKDLLIPNFKDALQGQVAGVQVTQSNGMPSSETTLRIRGTATIYGESEPLYLIDGVPVYVGYRETPAGGVGAGWGSVFSPLSDLNPDDIASVTFLKDAASAAIYGARGASGVVLITTKKGAKNRSLIDFKYSQGVTSATNKVAGLDGPQYLRLLDQSWVNSGQTGQGPLPAISGLTRTLAESTNTDQMSKILKNGDIRQMSLSTSYGSDKTSFYLSGSYRNENGILSGNNLTRYTGIMNVTNQITSRLGMGATVRMNFSNYFDMPVGYAPGGGFNAGQTNLPVLPFTNPTGTYFNELDANTLNTPGSNVASFQDKHEFDNEAQSKRIYIAANFNYTFSSALKFNTDVAMDQYFQTRSDYLSKRERNGSAGSGTGRAGVPTAYASYEKYTNNLYNIQSTLSYRKTTVDHNLGIVAGFEFNYNENPYFFAESEGFANDFARQPASATFKNQVTATALTTNISVLNGYYLTGNYAYKEKYLLNATLRVDGSSRFGADHKYAVYPGATAGWLLSKEDFLKDQALINQLKLRLSYGRTGNSGLGNYSSLEQWNINSNSRYLLQTGLQQKSLGSSGLKPESVNELDLGLDFAILKSRISGTIDVYNKVTNDLVLQYNAPLSAGVVQTSLLLNGGALRNRGIELSLSSQNLTGKLRWNTDLSFAHNSNQVTDLGGLQPLQVSSHKNIATFVGHPLGTFYLAEYAGVDPSTGQELIYDAAHNKVAATSAAQIDAARAPQYDKPSAPTFFGGLNNTFQYKSFDLAILMTFSYGNYVLDEGERQLSYLRGSNNLRATAANSWTTAQPGTDFPRLVYNDPIAGSNTTRFLHDASYLRAKNITLGYSLKSLFKGNKYLREARLSISAQNLFTITKFPGWDPEALGNYTTNVDRSLNQGITYLDVPQVRTIAAGLNLKF
jgi:TonB-linked SusC/RagA family outer membrane protein